MNSGTVPVTAEWALWGKESHDAGYRLLEYSDGPVPGDTFVEVLNRYSPGTLEDLPQVTVSWLRDHAQRNYVAIAIHDTEQGRYDAGGRQIVFTRYFCVRYEELAAGAVSYHSMYRELGKSRLGVNSRSMINAELPRFSAGPAEPTPRALAAAPQPGTPASGLAIRVAALLLTGQPVCVLRADRIGLDTRLRFLDEVMSLLPYGMRSRLSASTWVSSTFQEHKLRLFFASARRRADDHVVTWDRLDPAPIRHRYADDYLSWLINGVHEPAALLAGVNEQMGFGQAEIAMLLERLHVSCSQPPAPAHSHVPAGRSPAQLLPAQALLADPARNMSVPEILASCARRLLGGNPNFLTSDMDRLQACLAQPISAEERAQYQQIIAAQQLFRADIRIKKQLQTKLYGLLLQVAFKSPLTYKGYCAVYACAGYPDDKPLHRSLLLAVNPARQPDLRVQLLGLNAMGERELRHALRDKQLPPGALIAAAANRELRPHHARIICGIAVSDLRERTGRLDRLALRQALVEHGYLAAALAQLYPGRPQYQADQLKSLLYVTYGGKLDGQAIREVLAGPAFAPTTALFAAVLSMVDPGDAALAERTFTRGLIGHGSFAGRTREQLLQMLPAGDHLGAELGAQRKLRFSRRSARGLRRRPIKRLMDWRIHFTAGFLAGTVALLLCYIAIELTFR